MRLLTTITITITATTTLLATPTTAKAIEPKFHMETPCTPERESHRVCMIPKVHDNPAYTRDNMVVECEMGKWRIVERCHRWMPCIEQDSRLGEPYCWNDYDFRTDECPKDGLRWCSKG